MSGASSPQAVIMSATLHAGIVALVFIFSILFQRTKEEPVQVFELVAGEGDNYMAKEAPALGSPTGVTVSLPEIPEPQPAPPEPTPAPEPEPPPIVPAPIVPAPPPLKKETVAPKPAPKKVPDPTMDMAKAVRWEIIKKESQAKMDAAKRKAAEAKKAAEEKRRLAKLEEENRRLTKAEFDRANANKKTPPAKTPTTKVAKIDAEGIAKGVTGGSTANKDGGAGGKALVASDGRAVEMYFEMLKQRVRAQLTGLAGMEDHLAVTVAVNISAWGTLSNARVKVSSGNAEFDRAVIAAFDRVEMPAHPEKKSEELELIFRTRDIEGR